MMAKRKVLYISGSLGLGHITRDLAIANELRKLNSDIKISWLAAHPASKLIEEAGEHLLPEAVQYSNDNIPAEKAAKGPQLNLLKYLTKASKEKHYKYGRTPVFDLGLFVGQEEDVPDKRFGPMLPNRREWAKALLHFTGCIFPFNPKAYEDKEKIRAKLKYGKEPLIICSIGGTSIVRELLTLCGQAFPIIKEEIHDLRMILVCGPRITADSLSVSPGVEIREYVPALYEHFAECDLAIVQCGATSTLELTALRKSFLYFPIEGHFEQAQVAERLTRYKAGVQMLYSQTTPESLAEKAISILGEEVSYSAISTDGAKKAAQLINRLF